MRVHVALLAVALALAQVAMADDQVVERHMPYRVDIRLLGGLLGFELAGELHERIDLMNSRYEMQVRGRGMDVETAIDSSGILRDGRWQPRRTLLSFELYGRRWSSEAIHDPDAWTVEYRSRGETFFLRRVYTAEHVLRLAPGVHVDDVMSALLNYADERWPEDPDGSYTTFLVRRGPATRAGSSGRAYEAELRPVVLIFTENHGARSATASVDLVGLTTWALPDRPALIHFDLDRRPDDVRLRLKFATSVAMQLARGLGPIAAPRPVEKSGPTWRVVPDVRRVADNLIAASHGRRLRNDPSSRSFGQLGDSGLVRPLARTDARRAPFLVTAK